MATSVSDPFSHMSACDDEDAYVFQPAIVGWSTDDALPPEKAEQLKVVLDRMSGRGAAPTAPALAEPTKEVRRGR